MSIWPGRYVLAPTMQPVILSDHYEIHEGESYSAANFVDLGNAATYLILLVPGANVESHLVFSIDTEAEATVTVFENTLTSNNGTALPVVVARNRANVVAAAMAAYYAPTVTNNGTPLAYYKSGSTTRAGGEIRGESEWVLNPAYKYMIRIVNDTAVNNWISYRIDWYEES